jgi:hypothetical protein
MDSKEKLEFLLSIPNIAASFMCMAGFAYYANILFCIGFPPFIIINLRRNDRVHTFYFTLLWCMSLLGVLLYLMKWDISKLIP